MTNYEKNKKEIDMYVLTGEKWAIDKTTDEIVQCSGFSCEKCLFRDKPTHCSKRKMKWLKEEYIESEVDWSKIPVDTPVLVRNSSQGLWQERYFAGYIAGKVCIFSYGCTSEDFTDISAWKFAKLKTTEE